MPVPDQLTDACHRRRVGYEQGLGHRFIIQEVDQPLAGALQIGVVFLGGLFTRRSSLQQTVPALQSLGQRFAQHFRQVGGLQDLVLVEFADEFSAGLG
ncbi:hypothetical protein D3C81_1875810 [compost metagenome]